MDFAEKTDQKMYLKLRNHFLLVIFLRIQVELLEHLMQRTYLLNVGVCDIDYELIDSSILTNFLTQFENWYFLI